MNTEIELYSKLANPIEAIDRIGEFFAKSGMFGCDRIEQGKVLAMICLSEKKSPVEITRNYDIVDGKLRKKALAALADFRKAGGRQKWLKTGDEPAATEDDREAVGEFTFDGNTVTVRFAVRDARRQGLVREKSNWVKTPGNMLRARCASNAVAMLCPEIFAGEDSGESDSSPEIAPLLAPAAPVPAAIEIQVEPVAESSSAQPTTPAQPVPATATTFTAADIRTNPATGRLTVESTSALIELIGEDRLDAAVAWLIARGWIKATIDELSAERAARIFNKPAAFLETIKGK